MLTKITSRVLVFASELSSLRLSAEVRSVGVFKCFTLNSLEENSSNGAHGKVLCKYTMYIRVPTKLCKFV